MLLEVILLHLYLHLLIVCVENLGLPLVLQLLVLVLQLLVLVLQLLVLLELELLDYILDRHFRQLAH
jgi:hypothetical protein